jgi:hypothetical protein
LKQNWIKDLENDLIMKAPSLKWKNYCLTKNWICDLNSGYFINEKNNLEGGIQLGYAINRKQ